MPWILVLPALALVGWGFTIAVRNRDDQRIDGGPRRVRVTHGHKPPDVPNGFYLYYDGDPSRLIGIEGMKYPLVPFDSQAGARLYAQRMGWQVVGE